MNAPAEFLRFVMGLPWKEARERAFARMHEAHCIANDTRRGGAACARAGHCTARRPRARERAVRRGARASMHGFSNATAMRDRAPRAAFGPQVLAGAALAALSAANETARGLLMPPRHFLQNSLS